jgi:flagellar hook-basal body complex protein FliE
MTFVNTSIQPNSIPLPPAAPSIGGANQAGAADGSSFKNMLLDSIEQVNTMQQDANKAMESFATGGDTSPAEVLTAVQKADLAFRMMMQIRNKLVSAYQDIQAIRV